MDLKIIHADYRNLLDNVMWLQWLALRENVWAKNEMMMSKQRTWALLMSSNRQNSNLALESHLNPEKRPRMLSFLQQHALFHPKLLVC